MNTKALLAEFVGTFLFVFAVIGSIAAHRQTGQIPNLDWSALAQGAALAAMVSATAAISGGHLNPAVTFGAWLTRKIDLKTAIAYIIVQITAGFTAAALLLGTFPSETLQAVGMGAAKLGSTGTTVLENHVTVGMGLLMEFILTFSLVFVVFGTALDPRAPEVGGLYIGLAVTLGVIVGGPVTGAAMNPARYLGPAVLGGGGLENAWVYLIGEFAGGAAAAFIYQKLLAERRRNGVREREHQSAH
ncbi:MAG: aquaporin [Scytonema sp. PMC 1070.18]|nr:aquaporin [Scytonema sp. PMC 1070.18]